MVKMIEDVKCPHCGEEKNYDGLDTEIDSFAYGETSFLTGYHCLSCGKDWTYIETYVIKTKENVKETLDN